MRIRPWLIALVVIALAGCSRGAEDTTTTTTSSSTTTTTTTTTVPSPPTTIDDRPRSPINGLPVDDPDLLERRVLAVKIDNHWEARPQSGILEADAVFEIRVEGGLTRFMAVFHSSDSEYLGPIRSGRPSDAALVRPFEAVLVISGGQPWIRAGINQLGVPYIGDTRPGMFRISGRFAPHNLYGDTPTLREVADSRDLPDEPPPVALWEFGDLPEEGEEATEITFVFSRTTTTSWTWEDGRYLRSIDGNESSWLNPDGEPERIAADVIVAIVGRQYTASPPGGSSGSAVPATETIGSGTIHVFAEGRVVTGTWERESPADPFTLKTVDGSTLTVPPGFPWISVVPDSGEVSWSAEAD